MLSVLSLWLVISNFNLIYWICQERSMCFHTCFTNYTYHNIYTIHSVNSLFSLYCSFTKPLKFQAKFIMMIRHSLNLIKFVTALSFLVTANLQLQTIFFFAYHSFLRFCIIFSIIRLKFSSTFPTYASSYTLNCITSRTRDC